MPFVIDVAPVAIDLGVVQVHWYGLVVAVALAVAYAIANREAARVGLSTTVVADGAIWVGLAALAGGRALFILQNPLPDLLTDPAHILMVWMGGLSFYGGLAAGAVALVVFANRAAVPWLTALDIVAPAAALGQAIGHLGCLIGGDSFGIPTDVPWAVIYRNSGAVAPQGVPLHPTQAYEAIALAIVFLALWAVRRRYSPSFPGILASLYLGALAVIRFGLFFLRDEPTTTLGLKTAQWIGVGVFLSALALLLVARRRSHGLGPRPVLVKAD